MSPKKVKEKKPVQGPTILSTYYQNYKTKQPCWKILLASEAFYHIHYSQKENDTLTVLTVSQQRQGGKNLSTGSESYVVR